MNLPTYIVATAGFVINDLNQILLVKDNRKGWLFPGGIVENRENIIEALKREIKEESGIDVEVEKLICVSSNISEHPGYNGVDIVPTKVIFDFICKSNGGKLSSSEENSESKWYNQNEVIDLIEAPEIKERFKSFQNYNNQITYLTYITHPNFNLINKIEI